MWNNNTCTDDQYTDGQMESNNKDIKMKITIITTKSKSVSMSTDNKEHLHCMFVKSLNILFESVKTFL